MGVRSTVRRVRDSLLSKERTRKDLKIGIAGFYDRSSKLWEEVWGEVGEMTVTILLVVFFCNFLFLTAVLIELLVIFESFV